MAVRKKVSCLKSLLVVVLGLALLVLAIQGIFGKRGYLEIQDLQNSNQDLTKELEALKSENARTMEEIQSLKTNPAYIEKIAREELGLVRPGEIKIITQPKPENSAPSEEKPK